MNYIYKESQKFNQWWIWLILIGINVMSLVQCWQSISDHGFHYYSLFQIVITATSLAFFCVLKLETRISKEGIEVRFFPLHLSFIKISWNEVGSVNLRTYSALGEYGGWGIRYGFSKAGKAYNVSGNKGIQLELKNGSKLLIGTNKPEEVEKVLLHLHQ